eukprot:2262796-Prymnesium_polylepis.1
MPWLLRRSLGASRMLLIAFLCTAAGRLGLAAASWLPPTPTAVCSYIVLNLGQGLTSTLLKALMGRAAEGDRRGLLLGLLSSCEKLAGVIAPLAGGPIYSSALGRAAPACASALVALAGACIALCCPAALGALDAERKASGAPSTRPEHVQETPATAVSMDARAHDKTD